MPRSLMNAVVTFGDVAIPVKLHAATAAQGLRFQEVHLKDGSRIEHRRFCTAEDKEVPYDEVVQGYEVKEGEYAVLTKEQRAAATPRGDRTIAVAEFVPLEDIDPILFDAPYYLGAGDGGAEGYRVLHDALVKSARAGIARFVFHDRERLAALRPHEGVLVLHTLHVADELADTDDLRPDEAGRAPTDREAAMAAQLIESLHVDFDPGDYADEHREQLLALIERKAAGEVIEEVPEEPVEVSDDLAATLKASLDAARHSGRRRSGTRAPASRKSGDRRRAGRGH